MSRTATFVLAALALFLVLFPLALAKPGLPLTLKSDEPAYYLMALSLAHDRDLKCELVDIERLADEFPYNVAENLILASPDGWKTVYFGKPFLVSLIATPGTALFGANGFVATNMALLLLSVWMGALYLRQFNPEWLAMLYSAGFFLLSNAFAYVFWLHTEVLCIASVTGCLYFGLTPGSRRPGAGRLGRWLASEPVRLALSGAALVFGAYNKPFLALLGLPVVISAFRRRGPAGALGWIGGAAASAIVVCGLSTALIGEPTPYLGMARAAVEVDSFVRMPELPQPQPVGPSGEEKNSFAWIFKSFRVDRATLSNLGYFLVGRHTGLFPYAPFTLLSLLLFFVHRPRSLERWLLVGSLAGVALYSLTFIWFNWHGGGGFIGNRYYVNALPGFLFLVTRITPSWLPVVGFGLAGLFVGPIFFTPFGATVPSPTLQAHVRGAAFQLLPFENTLENHIPGYKGLSGALGSWIVGRADQVSVAGDELRLMGAREVELELRTHAPLVQPVIEVTTMTAPNRVRVELGGVRETAEFTSADPPGNKTWMILRAPSAELRRGELGSTYYSYRLVVRATNQVWYDETVHFRESPKAAPAKRSDPVNVELPERKEYLVRALVGAVLVYLGEKDDLPVDVYSVEWLDLPIPATLPAGRIASFQGRVRNASSGLWQAKGATRVEFGSRWIDPSGTAAEGLRSSLSADVPAGEEAVVRFEIETPSAPGTYQLVLDGVRQRVAWFADRRPGQELRRTVEIVPAGAR